MRHQRWIGRGALRIASLWAVVGVVWYTLSWFLIHGNVTDVRLEGLLEIAAGVAFIALSVFALSRMLDRHYRQLRRANEVLEQRAARRTDELKAEIAERARIEESLREAEQRFRDFSESSNDWMWETGPDLRFSYLSPRFAELTGLFVADVIGQRFGQALGPEAERSIEAALMAARRPFRDVVVAVAGADGVRACSISGQPVFDGQGGFAGFRGTGADVSQERAARASADMLQRRQAQILTALGEGVIAFDRQGRIDVVNPAARQMLGWGDDGLVGRRVTELTGEAVDLAGLSAATLQGGDAAFHRRDGGTLPVEFVLAPVVEDGTVTGAVLAFRDRSERLAADEALHAAKDTAERTTRAKSEFLARMSHELRTPLNAIVGFADIVLSELFGPIGNARYRDYIVDIRRSGQHLQDLIDDIVDLSRIEAGKLELSVAAMDVAEMVEAAFAMIRTEAQRTGSVLVNNVPGNLPPAMVDPRRFKQVLLNLLSNAVKFTPSGGRITVSAEVDADGALSLRVADTGAGISADDLPRVTEAFVHGDSLVSGGAGLGLPLSKQLVELHGGTLSIASALGQGTTVSLRLPPSRIAAIQAQPTH